MFANFDDIIWCKSHNWEKTHKIGEGWEKRGEITAKRGKDAYMALLFKEGEIKPWCVNYLGTGHYFETYREAKYWVFERIRRK